MKKITTILSALFLATLVAAVSARCADQTGGIPKFFGSFIHAKGAWAEYEILEKSTQKKSAMKMTVVDVLPDNEFWYEVKNTEEGSSNIIKMLVVGDPNDPANIKRLIMKSGSTPAREMPVDFVKMGRKMAVNMFQKRSGVPEDARDISLKDLGEKEAKVPAGTFKCSEKQIVSSAGKIFATYLFSEAVPPFGIVVSESEDAVMTLQKHGQDGVSEITETPIISDRPPMMPEMPRGMPMGMDNMPMGMPGK